MFVLAVVLCVLPLTMHSYESGRATFYLKATVQVAAAAGRAGSDGRVRLPECLNNRTRGGWTGLEHMALV